MFCPAEMKEMTEIEPSQMAGGVYGSPKGEKLNENLIQNLSMVPQIYLCPAEFFGLRNLGIKDWLTQRQCFLISRRIFLV